MSRSRWPFSDLIFLIAIVLVAAGARVEGTEPVTLPPEELAKLPPDGGEKYNRLVFEKSPYLLQHAANPVDWLPWGEAAFELARKEDKPVFLSIGYSTCHWCHVMERESFADPEVAAMLNRDFVCVKVDREERPDIDTVYMNVTIAMNGSGGWPMTVLLTPDKLPFFSGTYFPKEGKFGKPGMLDLLPKISQVWREQREKILESAHEIKTVMSEGMIVKPAENAPGEATLRTAAEQLAAQFDDENGGFGIAPKFPTPHQLLFLLRWWKRSGDAKSLEMVENSLAAMRRGGIFDHVGLGFHRYSTDPTWHVPHFEKMLYDQAMLMMACTEAWQATGNETHAQTAREILEYVSTMLTSPEGAFYCAEDADSEGEEGKFYHWTEKEFTDVLGAEDAKLFGEVFDVRAEGNFAPEGGGEKVGQNILRQTRVWTDEAEAQRWELARKKLLAARAKRVRPLRDDKALADWNGLMIAALAKAGAASADSRFTDAAIRAADFVLLKMRKPDGRLHHRWRGGEAGLPAHLDDYAFMVWGLIELYEATFEVNYLRAATELNDVMMRDFEDKDSGGFFFTAHDAESLMTRPKEFYDGAIPSGNAVAALNLLRLARMTGRTELEKSAVNVMKAAGDNLRLQPIGHTQLMCALDFAIGPSHEIILAGDATKEDFVAMRRALSRAYLPNKVVLHRPPDDAESSPEIVELSPFTKLNIAREGKATAYVCKNFACHAPTTEIAVMLEAMGVAKKEN